MEEACSGCDKRLSLSQLSKHERSCAAYRDSLDRTYLEQFHLYRDRANNYEEDIREMNDRMDLQLEEIEDLEDRCEGYKISLAVYETEKRVYAYEQQNVLSKLNKLTRPLQMITKRLQDVQSTVDILKKQVRDSKENHKVFAQKRRRLGLDSEEIVVEMINQVPLEDEAYIGEDADADTGTGAENDQAPNDESTLSSVTTV